MKLSGKTRTERDLIGTKEVPVEYYFGVQTLRAMENFDLSYAKLYDYPHIVNALADVKIAAAKANHELGYMEEQVKNAIVQACNEIKEGKYHDQFVVDMIQGGAGTSTNMNANEVIANRALEIMGHEKGEYKYCHPNNHVNLAQSTNDAYPTAMNLGIYNYMGDLMEEMVKLAEAFRAKSEEFVDVIKMGRTHLQDAVPMTLGQEFEAFAMMIEEELPRMENRREELLTTNMGATAIGTGINADPDFASICTSYLAEASGLPVKEAENLIVATSDTTTYVMNSSIVKRVAVKLSKIANDLRLTSSGPRAGFNEINTPPVQPGSSIMPGKVNPVILEVFNQVAFKIIGNDTTITMGVEAGQLQLNVMEPVMAYSLLESIEYLTKGIRTMRTKCIEGITANVEHLRETTMNNIGLITAVSPFIAYDELNALAAEVLESGRGVYELILERGLLDKEELDDILKPEHMIAPRRFDKK